MMFEGFDYISPEMLGLATSTSTNGTTNNNGVAGKNNSELPDPTEELRDLRIHGFGPWRLLETDFLGNIGKNSSFDFSEFSEVMKQDTTVIVCCEWILEHLILQFTYTERYTATYTNIV